MDTSSNSYSSTNITTSNIPSWHPIVDTSTTNATASNTTATIYTGNGLLDQINSYVYTYPYSVSSNEPSSIYVRNTFKRLPTILKIKKAFLIRDKLAIKYSTFLNKYLPNEGTLYFPKINLYATFDKTDDKYWYKSLELTYNKEELNQDIKLLNNSFCILINDFDIKLDNTEIINLCDTTNYKEYAHNILEEELSSSPGDKFYKVRYHDDLEKELVDLHD